MYAQLSRAGHDQTYVSGILSCVSGEVPAISLGCRMGMDMTGCTYVYTAAAAAAPEAAAARALTAVPCCTDAVCGSVNEGPACK